MSLKGKRAPDREKGDSEMMRRFKSNPFVFIGSFAILILVVVTFVGGDLLSGGAFGSDGDLTFGYYDKVPISYVQGNHFAQYYEWVVRRWQSFMGSEHLHLMQKQMWREAFEAAAVHTAILQEMKLSGYKAPAKIVDREVAQLPHFQENGRFSPALYRQMDDNSRISLWRQVQEEYAANIFRSDVAGLLKSSSELDFISLMASFQRNFEMAVFSVEDYPDEEYEAYARNNAHLFRSAHLSMITINSSEREARRILASIRDGEITFEDAARTHSKNMYADRGGDMGARMAHALRTDIPDEAIREQVLALEKGAYSDVLKMNASWVIFRAEEAVHEADIADPMVMDGVRFYVRNFERGRMENWALAQADSFIALINEYGFEEALSLREIESRSFGPIPINFGGVELFTTIAAQSVNELGAAASNDLFWNLAFSTPLNTPSQPVVQGDNVLVLFPVAEIEADETVITGISDWLQNEWLENTVMRSLSQHFLNNPKMKNNFDDTYDRFFN